MADNRLSSAQALVDNPRLTLRERGTQLKRELGKPRRDYVKFGTSVSDKIEGAVFNKRFGRGGAKAIAKRSVGSKKVLQALGAFPSASSGQQFGRGRPKGTYKYGVPIQEYKRLQSQRKALYKQYASQNQEKLSARGFTPQQVQQLQIARTTNQPVTQTLPDTVDDEVQFQRFVAERTVTPNTQAILDNLKRIQNKAITDDINQQRIHRERKMINEQQSLLKARNLFGPDSNKINIFDDTGNPLKAENLFAREKQTNVFAPTGRPTILQSAQAGTQLNIFNDDYNILNAPKVFSLESSSPHQLRFF